jgi:hypothetical protein
VRVLLDESVPRPLAALLKGHDVTTVGQHGWAGIRNGELLERASAEFDVLVTVDKNLPRQLDLRRYQDGTGGGADPSELACHRPRSSGP